MTGTTIYRILIAIRGSWLVIEWFFDWGASSHVTTFTLAHPFAALVAHAMAVAFWLAMLLGMWFFQRWARLIFALLAAVAVLSIPFRMQRYSLSSPPSFVPLIGALMLLVTVTILVISFLPPVRDHFATKVA